MRVQNLGAVAVRSGGGTPDQDQLTVLVRAISRSAFIQPDERRLERNYAVPTVFEAPPGPLSTTDLIRESHSA